MPDGMSNATIAGSSTETVTVSSNQATNVLTLSDANATLAVTNSASLSAYGGLAVSAAHEIDLTGTLSIGGGGTQILDNTMIKIGGLASSIPGFPPFAEYGWLNVQQDTVLVLGPNLTVDLAYGQINASTPSATPGGFTLINDGTITADTNGGSTRGHSTTRAPSPSAMATRSIFTRKGPASIQFPCPPTHLYLSIMERSRLDQAVI